MRVVLDVSAVPAKPAGAGRYIVELASRLPGVTPTTLVTRRGDEERWRQWSPAATRAPIVPNARPLRLATEALYLGYAPVGRGAVWHGPHYTMPRTGRRPTVVTICDLTFFTNPEWHEPRKVTFFQSAIRYAATHADVLVSISQTTTDLLHDVVRPTVPVVTAPLGVALDRFTLAGDDAAVLAPLQLPADVPALFFLGTVEPRKGLDVLLAAFDELAASDPSVELWVAGQAGWGETPLDQALRTSPFASRIRRLGYVEDAQIPALMRRATAVVYPSRGEGFGLPVLEALACGARVLTTADTVMQEVAGTAAWYTAKGDVGELAGAMHRALTVPVDDAERARARARAETFQWSTTVTRHLEAYQLAQR